MLYRTLTNSKAKVCSDTCSNSHMQTRRQTKYPRCTNVKMGISVGVNVCIHAFVHASPVSPRPFGPFRYYLPKYCLLINMDTYRHMSMRTSITSYLWPTSNPFQRRSSVKLGVSGRSAMLDGHGSQRVPESAKSVLMLAFLCVRKLCWCVHLGSQTFLILQLETTKTTRVTTSQKALLKAETSPFEAAPISERKNVKMSVAGQLHKTASFVSEWLAVRLLAFPQGRWLMIYDDWCKNWICCVGIRVSF